MWCDFSELKGKTITKIDGAVPGSDVIHFYTSDGAAYQMYHQ